MMSKTELHSQTRCYLRHIYLHVQCKRIRFRSVGCNYMHTRKQNDNYKRWRRRKQLLITQGACTQSAEELASPVGVTKWQDIRSFYHTEQHVTYPGMQNDPEAISCEPWGEGGDSRVVGTDHFTEGPPGEGTSLTVNVKYDLLDSPFWNTSIRVCVYKGLSGFRSIWGMYRKHPQPLCSFYVMVFCKNWRFFIE